MRFDVLTLFPGMFSGYLGQSLLEKAIARGLVEVHLHDFRQWTTDKHQQVDDRPFGGGPGMVIKVEPVVECVESLRRGQDAGEDAGEDPGKLILLTPQGQPLRQPRVEQWAVEQRRLILLCGRYEGFDQRVSDVLEPEEVSLGDYVLNGGEVAAMAIIDAVIRLVPGVLGDEQSSQDDSFSSGNRLLEFPQYTRPREFRGRAVPDVLLSGDHQAIARWREQQTLERTRQRRADLLAQDPPENHSEDGDESGTSQQS